MPSPAQSAIRLDLRYLKPLDLIAYLHDLTEGLMDNPYYLNLPEDIVPALSDEEEELIAQAAEVTNLEGLLRSARAAQEDRMTQAKEGVRTTAFACEQINRTDAALLSANWKLRRPAGPAQPMGTPTRLVLENNPLPGEIRARWTRVANARYYEVQAATTDGTAPIVWDTLPILNAVRVNLSFTGRPVGSFLSVRVRAVGSRGAGPWCDSITARLQ